MPPAMKGCPTGGGEPPQTTASIGEARSLPPFFPCLRIVSSSFFEKTGRRSAFFYLSMVGEEHAFANIGEPPLPAKL